MNNSTGGVGANSAGASSSILNKMMAKYSVKRRRTDVTSDAQAPPPSAPTLAPTLAPSAPTLAPSASALTGRVNSTWASASIPPPPPPLSIPPPTPSFKVSATREEALSTGIPSEHCKEVQKRIARSFNNQYVAPMPDHCRITKPYSHSTSSKEDPCVPIDHSEAIKLLRDSWHMRKSEAHQLNIFLSKP